MGGSSGKGEATRWEQSKNKGDLGYYFAHHTSHKELAPEEYQMNGPKLLSKVKNIYEDFNRRKMQVGWLGIRTIEGFIQEMRLETES